MAKTLLIGGSSAIASALRENSDREFISLSRSEGTLDLDGDLNELDSVADINGLVYFPGTKILLKGFFHDTTNHCFLVWLKIQSIYGSWIKSFTYIEMDKEFISLFSWHDKSKTLRNAQRRGFCE